MSVDIARVKKLLVGMATNYGLEPTLPQVEIWASVLDDVPYEQLQAACREILKDPAFNRMPLPAQIRARALGIKSPEELKDDARDIGGRIWEAIGDFGQWRAEEAQKTLEGIAWQVIQRMGGWRSVCQVSNSDRTSFVAQCRDLAESCLRTRARDQIKDQITGARPASVLAFKARD